MNLELCKIIKLVKLVNRASQITSIGLIHTLVRDEQIFYILI